MNILPGRAAPSQTLPPGGGWGNPVSPDPCARAAPSQTLPPGGGWGNPVSPSPCVRARPSQIVPTGSIAWMARLPTSSREQPGCYQSQDLRGCLPARRDGGPAALLKPVVARPGREHCGQFARLPGRRGPEKRDMRGGNASPHPSTAYVLSYTGPTRWRGTGGRRPSCHVQGSGMGLAELCGMLPSHAELPSPSPSPAGGGNPAPPARASAE